LPYVESIIIVIFHSLTDFQVFFAALIAYGLVHLVPFWGLALVATTVTFVAPLIYVQNRKVIDEQVENVTHMVNTQASQLKDITVHHTNQAMTSAKAYADEYSQKAQEYVGRRQSTAPTSSTTGSSGPALSNNPSSGLGNTSSGLSNTSSGLGSSSSGLGSTSGVGGTTTETATTSRHIDSFPSAPKQEPLPTAPSTDPLGSSYSQQLAAERESLLHQ
jgi:hypothetical protein